MSLDIHIKTVLSKVNKAIGLLQSLEQVLHLQSFLRRHLDYSDIVFDQTFNNSFNQKLDCI